MSENLDWIDLQLAWSEKDQCVKIATANNEDQHKVGQLLTWCALNIASELLSKH